MYTYFAVTFFDPSEFLKPKQDVTGLPESILDFISLSFLTKKPIVDAEQSSN